MTDARSNRSGYRKVAAAVGMLSAFSLAGCSESGPGSASGADDQADPSGGADGTTAGDDATPGGGTEAGETGTAGPGVGTPVGTCDDETLSALEDERRGLEDQLTEIEYESRQLRTGARATEFLLEQLDPGFPAQTLERGQAVGLGARPSVVILEILDGGLKTGHATAWFVDDGYLFTNAHNVSPSGPDTTYRGVTQDGERFDVEVVDFVEGTVPDVALLRTDYRGPDPLPMAGVEELETGQPLVQVGNPDEVGFWIISMGRFIGGRVSRTVDGTEYTALKSVVPGRPGVSGSPLLTLDGAVVGMTHGGEPVATRELGAVPPVAPDIVFDGPIGDVVVSLHDGSDILEQKLEAWR